MKYLGPWILALSFLTYFVVETGAAMVYSVVTPRWTPLTPPPLEHPTSTTRPVKSGNPFQDITYAAADLCGIDRPFAWSLALRESSGRHWDSTGQVLRSSSAAWGLFQIKEGTARDVDPSLDIMLPWGNALAGLCHFRQLLDAAKGDERLALRWYHRGRWAKAPVPQATHDYVDDIMEGASN
jgi:hypothetical protein